MDSTLRPLSLGEILDRTAQLYRTNFLLFAGIFAVFSGVGLALNLIQIGLQELIKAMHLDKWMIPISGTATALDWLILFLLFGATVAAISRAVAWVHLGQPATIRGSYQAILPRLGRYLWLMTITGFITYIPLILLYAGLLGGMLYLGMLNLTHPGAAPHPSQQQAVTFLAVFAGFGLLIIPALIYAVIMSLRYSLALPACLIEDMKARAAIRRSIDLSKGSRGRIFVLALLIGFIKLALLALTQSFVFVAAFRHPGQPLSPGIAITSVVIQFFTNTFLGPVYATGITLFYYDQRIRKEGYDIEWMMQAAGLTWPPPWAGIESSAPIQLPPPETAAPTSPGPSDPQYDPALPSPSPYQPPESPYAREPDAPEPND